jgi:hypothetical protein
MLLSISQERCKDKGTRNQTERLFLSVLSPPVSLLSCSSPPSLFGSDLESSLLREAIQLQTSAGSPRIVSIWIRVPKGSRVRDGTRRSEEEIRVVAFRFRGYWAGLGRARTKHRFSIDNASVRASSGRERAERSVLGLREIGPATMCGQHYSTRLLAHSHTHAPRACLDGGRSQATIARQQSEHHADKIDGLDMLPGPCSFAGASSKQALGPSLPPPSRGSRPARYPNARPWLPS